ncbi:prolyl oligopeptidase family serine peptidase [Chryseobacterium sp. KACC 21268]|nr:prolyl oligopeptidase family serine peptidase [Chryseobacterium sp. KACC 21268]
MKAIRIYIAGLLLIYGLGYSQNIDSLTALYKQFYQTALLTASPNGQYVVLKHTNTYGKDEDELVDIRSSKGTMLDKHVKYQFLGDDVILMQNNNHSRFLNLKNGQNKDIAGNYSSTLAQRSGQVVLYNTSSKDLLLVSDDGKVLWKENGIRSYHLDEIGHRLIYASGNHIVFRDLKNQKSKRYKLDSGVQWIFSHNNRIYCADIERSKVELYIIDLPSDHLTKQIIMSPEAFEFATAINTYFELREGEHFIFPMYLKSKLNAREDPEMKITYSNRNGKDHFLNHHLGIYNIKEKRWDYRPDQSDHLPVYRFLNDKGDFVVYDQSNDVVEEQQNVILDLNLILDYGKSSRVFPQKRADDGNYFWDRSTEQFIYFENKRWLCHHIRTGIVHELLPLKMDGWENPRDNGLVDAPAVMPIKIKGGSSLMLSDRFDYYIVDLKTHQMKQITSGRDKKIKYELKIPAGQYPKSSWSVKFAEIDLDKEITFNLLDKRSYDSGFATYLHKKNKTHHYQQGHYKELLRYGDGLFLTSQFAMEPFKLTKFDKGKYTVVYESMKTERKGLENIQYKIYQYETRYGEANAALLFPKGYDRQKKYPMIVNIYQQQSRDLLFFVPPYLNTRIGFNYMHYLMNGYIVLLPDLQHEIANVKNSVVTSLEKSIDTAKSLASVDDRNIGVVGLSYGGYETGLAVTNSKYFKTGVAGVMISDLVFHAFSQSEVMSMPNYMRTETHQMRMKNNVFDSWNTYLDNSPVFHIKKIDIPVLIWSGLKDKNVPATQSKMFFLGMKRLQKKAVILEYTNETHNVFSPPNQLDLNVKIWQWFEHYLKNKPPADWIDPITK